MPSPEDVISEAFNSYFEEFDIRIGPEDVAVGSPRRIGGRGWVISYRVDPDHAGLPSLELYATNRMTNDRHVRIRSDGRMEVLEAIHESFAYDRKVPGAKEAAEQAYLAHNRAVAEDLRAKGLYPEGDINAFLRTGGAKDKDPPGSTP